MGPVERMVRRQRSLLRLYFLDRFQAITPHQKKSAGRTNEPMTVTIGDIDGFEALINPPSASAPPMTKNRIESTFSTVILSFGG